MSETLTIVFFFVFFYSQRDHKMHDKLLWLLKCYLVNMELLVI